MRKSILLFIVLFMIISFMGCKNIRNVGSDDSLTEEIQPASSVIIGENDAEKISSKVPIHLYFKDESTSKLKMEIRYIPVEEVKKSVNNLAAIVVNELIKGPSKDGKLKATIPEGTVLKSNVIINSGVATIDLSESFLTKHPGGKENEQITIYSIVNSLTELREIEKVKFLIEGKPSKEFKGNFKFDRPFPRSNSIIEKSSETTKETNSIQTTPTGNSKETNSIQPTPKGNSKETNSTQATPKEDDKETMSDEILE